VRELADNRDVASGLWSGILTRGNAKTAFSSYLPRDFGNASTARQFGTRDMDAIVIMGVVF